MAQQLEEIPLEVDPPRRRGLFGCSSSPRRENSKDARKQQIKATAAEKPSTNDEVEAMRAEIEKLRARVTELEASVREPRETIIEADTTSDPLFRIAQYNILAGYLGDNTQPWFLYGIHCPEERRAEIMTKFYQTDDNGKLMNKGWVSAIETQIIGRAAESRSQARVSACLGVSAA